MEGVRCWDGHTTAHTPNEMHQSSGEGMGVGWGLGQRSCWVEVRGLVQRDQGGKGIKHGSGRGRAPHCRYALAYGSDLGHSGLGRVVETLFPGGLSQEGGVRVGFASCFCRSSSQCHSTSNK